MKNILSLFADFDKISSRLEAIEVLETYFDSLETANVAILTYLFEGLLAPDFVCPKLNFSKNSLLNLLQEYIETKYSKPVEVKKLFIKYGDIGSVVEVLWQEFNKLETTIGLEELYEDLWQLARISGKNSVARKLQFATQILNKLSANDAKYVARILGGRLRVGFSKKTLLDVFVKHLLDSTDKFSKKELRQLMDHAYGVSSDLGYIANFVYNKDWNISQKIEKLQNLEPVVGIPIYPQLVQRVGSFEEVFDRYPDGIWAQPKYDGLRFQLHIGVDYKNEIFQERLWTKFLNQEEETSLFEKANSNVKAFSRNLQDIGDSFPEVLKDPFVKKCDNCILDGELVAMKDGKFIPFQNVMQRKRKYDVEQFKTGLPVYYFVFDIIAYKNNSTMRQPFEERMKLLKKLFENVKQKHIRVTRTEFVKNLDELENVFGESVEKGFEGIVLKRAGTPYLPGVRNFDWIKLKKSINNKVVDTVDAVVMGYYKATGDKLDTKLGAMLVGLFNKDTDMFESLTKVGTGMSDEQRKRIAEVLDGISVNKKPIEYVVDKNLYPDVWVTPSIVITIDADEITKSTVHMVGKKELGFGLSLRFPRLVEFGRDKDPDDATSTQELIEMYKFEKEKGGEE